VSLPACHYDAHPLTRGPAVHEPKGSLVRAEDYEGDNPRQNRSAATILSLVRNSELKGMIQSMKDLEATWNHKFNYPWTFINDEPFTSEFKKKTQAETKAKCNYREIWSLYLRRVFIWLIALAQTSSPKSTGRFPRGSTRIFSRSQPSC
jgi:hypothetical protein